MQKIISKINSCPFSFHILPWIRLEIYRTYKYNAFLSSGISTSICNVGVQSTFLFYLPWGIFCDFLFSFTRMKDREWMPISTSFIYAEVALFWCCYKNQNTSVFLLFIIFCFSYYRGANHWCYSFSIYMYYKYLAQYCLTYF